MNNTLFCIDSSILIWTTKKDPTPDEETKIERIKRFIEHLHNINARILLPTPVLTELLIKIPKEEHAQKITYFQKNFIIPAFDLKSVSICAEITDHFLTERQKNKLNIDISKVHLKFDCMIIAIAKAYNVVTLYTEDDGMLSLGNEYVHTSNIPDLPIQMPLFS